MKKISFRVRNFDKEQFLTFNIDNEAELDVDLLDFMEDEEPKGVVSVIFEEDEEYDTFSYNITDKIHVSELSNQEINAEMVLRVLRGLILALIDMTEYRIPISYLVLHRNYIYVDSDYKIEFICVPLEDMKEEVDLNGFLRNFLASLRFEPSENGDYVARLFTYINNHAIFNLRNMVTLVEELMGEMNIEVPEDESADIYAEYHEVAEGEGAPFESERGDTTILAGQESEDEDASEEITDESADADSEKEQVFEEEEVFDGEEESEEKDELEENVEEIEPDSESEEISEEGQVIEDDSESEELDGDTEEIGTTADLEAEEGTLEEDEDEEVTDAEPDKSQEIVNKLKEKITKGSKKKVQESTVEESDDRGEPSGEEKKDKKPIFKTKEATVTGVVIQDELDEFLAEKEMEEKAAHHEETGLKIKKNIKINRASIVKNTQEELKAAEEAAAETEVTETEEEEIISNSILSQTIGNTGILKNAEVPKANPYLIRVNTDQRVMITKQNFKIGKASMGVDYTVKGNGAVSRVHAIITNKDGIYYIKDNKSTNHTYVNGKTIEDGESELLTHDCKIVLGDEEFIFKLR